MASILNDIKKVVPPVAAIIEGIEGMFPTLEDEIIVTVYGKPGRNSSLQDLYQVAASAAFGVVANRTVFGVLPPAGMIMVEYDYAQSYVRMTLRYRVSTAVASANKSLQAAGGWKLWKDLQVFGNISDRLVGGPWNFTSGLAPGLPLQSTAPSLRYAGKEILTRSPVTTVAPGVTAPSSNPVPAVDGKSRASLVQLVYAALSSPCTTQGMTFPAYDQVLPTVASGGSM